MQEKQPHGNTGNRYAAKLENEKKTARLHVPCTSADKSKWVRTAKPGKLSEWVTKTLNAASK